MKFLVLTVESIENGTLWYVTAHALIGTKLYGDTSQKAKIFFYQNQSRTSWKILRIEDSSKKWNVNRSIKYSQIT